MEKYNNLKGKIELLLLKKNMTKTELAEKMGITKQLLNYYLNSDIRISVVRKIVRALNVSIFDII